jgi:hypothetical protein
MIQMLRKASLSIIEYVELTQFMGRKCALDPRLLSISVFVGILFSPEELNQGGRDVEEEQN